MQSKFHLARLVGAVLMCGALLGTAATSVFAQSAPAASDSISLSALSGQLATSDSDPVGYYVWHDDHGYHLRTHGPGAEHQFVARLTTNGTFEDVDASMLEKVDQYTLSQDRHTLVLRFHTYDRWDGVNFRIDAGESMRLNLRLDGQEISTANIFLGPGRTNPPTNPFKIEI